MWDNIKTHFKKLDVGRGLEFTALYLYVHGNGTSVSIKVAEYLDGLKDH
jgi:hypothetical protein